MTGVCPECGGAVRGRKCAACGWSQTPEPAKSKGEYEHTPFRRCGWFTDGRQCYYLAIMSTSEHCAWHREWERICFSGKPERSQREELGDWLVQFQKGSYASNPGSWGHETATVWHALTGMGQVPISQGVSRHD